MTAHTNEHLEKVAFDRGADAHAAGEPVENNPYINKSRGRVSYRAWRRGWYESERIKLDTH